MVADEEFPVHSDAYNARDASMLLTVGANGRKLERTCRSNGAYLPNGFCKHQYPFCFDAIDSIETVYSPPSGSDYTLDDDWDQETCWLPGYSHGKCWNSDTELGWLSWPVEADAERTITIYHYPEYHWTSCYCGHKKFSTPTYDVD